MVGRTISHYEIVEKLGEGGMGVVYRARDTHLDRFVAIKVLPAEKVVDPERKRRFVQEAKAASALSHANIIHVYDIDQADGIDFISMEYVAGKTLDRLIPRHGVPLNEALKYSIQIADALAAAHEAGIVHRDLKPGNVMVTDKGQVKVLDFGLAKLTETTGDSGDAETRTIRAEEAPSTSEGKILGTVAYMSPEQAQGKKVDARSDIFSFGSLLYEMITGRRAFQGDSKVSTLAAILKEEPKAASQIVEGLPKEIERLISRCLRKDLSNRFQHMDDVKIALEELKEESDSGKLGPAPVPPPRPRRWLWAGAVLAVIVVAIGFWWHFKGVSPGPQPHLAPVQLTTLPGREGQATFSPEGQQVAFTWNGQSQDNWDIYVKFLEEATPHRLTDHRAADYAPAWSPDGRRIAFCRAEQGTQGVYWVSPYGGQEQKLADLNSATADRVLSWSPDGKRLAFQDRDRTDEPFHIFLLDLETRDRRSLRISSTEALHYLSPTFSPDARDLAFIGAKTPGAPADIYLVSVSGGEPKRLTFDNQPMGGLAWTPDGQEILFSSGFEDHAQLWSIRLSDRSPKRLVEVGEGAVEPAVSRDGRRLAYTHSAADTNIWRYDTRGQTPPRKLIESTKIDENPSFSPDGKHIAFVSMRSGDLELWRCDSEGSNPVKLTSFGGPVIGWPSWSPDGRQVAFDSYKGGNIDLYVVNAEGGAPRRLTTHGGVDARPRWSTDGKWIYFMSNRSGRSEIWKTPVEGGENAVQLTQNGGDVPVVSADGRFVYYYKRPGIWRIPAEGGEEVLLLGSGPSSGINWTTGPNGIYFLDRQGKDWSLKHSEFAGGRVKRLFGVPPPGECAPAISPDDRWLLYAQYDQAGSDLMLVENFR